MEALAEALAKEFGTPKFFRPYRDVRFSKDKTPYKTHQGSGSASRRVPARLGGRPVWSPAATGTPRRRRSTGCAAASPTTSPGRRSSARSPPCEKKGFEIGEPQLTRVPSGYEKDHPRAELLRHKSLTASREFGCPDWLATKRAQTEITKAWRAIAPLIDWLDTHVGRD